MSLQARFLFNLFKVILPALSGLIIFALIYPATRSYSSLSFIIFMVLTILIAALFSLLVALGSVVRIIGEVGNEQLNTYFEDNLISSMDVFLREVEESMDSLGGISISDDIFQDARLELDVRALEVEFFDFSGGEMVNFHA